MPRRISKKQNQEGGYVIAMTALLLIPMMIFAAFATDVGAWYVRGQEVQRASDAAALAAVVWMPDEATATAVAIDVAARNGFVDQAGDYGAPGVDLPQVQVTRVTAQRLRVDIMAEGDLYFGTVIDSFQPPQISRFATAEYILPVPMGNPTSALGTGVDTDYGPVDSFWIDNRSTCEIRINGDFIGGGQILPTYAPHSTACDVVNPPNPNYRDEGYSYILDVPDDGSGATPAVAADTYVVQVRLSCFNQRRGTAPNERWEGNMDGTLQLTVYDPDNTPLNDSDNRTNDLTPTSGTFQKQNDGTCGPILADPGDAPPAADPLTWRTASDPATWQTVAVLPANQPGRYLMDAKNISNDDGTDLTIRRTQYSLRIVPQSVATAGTNWSCSRIGASAAASCPNIYAADFLSVYTAGTMFNDGQYDTTPGPLLANLYLAEVEDVHAGKTLQITMFDPADGIEIVRILDPFGNAVPVSWQTIDVAEYSYDSPDSLWSDDTYTDIPLQTQTCSGGTGCITANSQVTGGGGHNFQDRTIRIEVDLPPTYGCETIAGQPDNCWWQVQYEDSNKNATEQTTWGVRIIGDPVRLVE